MPQFRKILCPVDFDRNSMAALGAAAELARERKAALYLLHVVAIPPGPEVAIGFGKMEAMARSKLKRLAQRKLGRKIRYEVNIGTGDPRSEILLAAKRGRADLIVMATHGRKGLSHLVLGSVAEAVVREAPCPVLTIRPAGTRTVRSRVPKALA